MVLEEGGRGGGGVSVCGMPQEPSDNPFFFSDTAAAVAANTIEVGRNPPPLASFGDS